MYPTFLEVPPFPARWESLGLGDEELAELQRQLGADPTAGRVVPGGGGLRKVRFSPTSRPGGKSGAFRVYYAHLPGVGVIVLAVALAKSEAADIGVAQRRALARLVAAVEARFTGGEP